MWELVARERIRDTLGRYNWSGDAGLANGLAESFCEDGVLEIRGFEPLHGRSAIAEFVGGVAADITAPPDRGSTVRHNVTNIMFDEVTDRRAEVRSYFTVITHIGLDHCGRYRDTFVPSDDSWLIKHRKVSTDWAAIDSVMAR